MRWTRSRGLAGAGASDGGGEFDGEDFPGEEVGGLAEGGGVPAESAVLFKGEGGAGEGGLVREVDVSLRSLLAAGEGDGGEEKEGGEEGGFHGGW